MNQIVFSPIHNKDEIDQLLGQSSFQYTYDESLITLLKKNFDLKDSLYLLAKQEDEFVGFCSIDRDWWEENYFFIREIIVSTKFHRQGIGKQLMQTCIDHAKSCHAKGVITQTDFENTPMQNLCEHLGFKKWDNPAWKKDITYKLDFSL